MVESALFNNWMSQIWLFAQRENRCSELLRVFSENEWYGLFAEDYLPEDALEEAKIALAVDEEELIDE